MPTKPYTTAGFDYNTSRVSDDLDTIKNNFEHIQSAIIETTTPPANATEGQIYLDANAKDFLRYNSTTGTWERFTYSYLNGRNFKNRIINGDFSVWQRGTTFTFTAGVYSYTVDRFTSYNTSDGQFTISKSTMNNKNALRITVDTPPTDLTLTNHWSGVDYRFEGQHLYDLAINGKDITISFWFNSNVAGEYSVALRNKTDSTVNIQSYVTSFNYTTANTPQKVEITIPLNAVWNPALKNDNAIGFILHIAFLNQGDFVAPSVNAWIDGNYLTTPTAVNWGATAGNFIEIAEVQLEEGNVATDFEYVPFDVQLLRCMRYYEKNDTVMWFLSYIASASTGDNITYQFKVPKRARPTVTLTEIGFKLGDGTIGIYNAYEYGFVCNMSTGRTTTGSSRVQFSFVADAEL